VRDVRNTIVGAVLVFAAYYLGLVVVNVSGLPIPGPLMGLFLLLAMLFLFPQLEVHTARFVTFPLKHMSLLFIPAVLAYLFIGLTFSPMHLPLLSRLL